MRAIALAAVASLILVLFLVAPVNARPSHPDVAVMLSMKRDGSTVTVQADFQNQGQVAAHNVRTSLALPPGSWVIQSRETSCTSADCRFQEIGPGAKARITATLHEADCDAQSAKASAQTPSDKVGSNDQATASIPSACSLADVSVHKFGHRLLADVTFDLLVANHGPRDARNVVLVDQLPDMGARWRIDGPDRDACTLDGLRLTCRWASVPEFSQTRVEVSAGASPCRPVTNTATIDSADDPEDSNDQSTAYVPDLCTSGLPHA